MAYETFLRLPEEKQKLIITYGLREFAAKNYADANTDVITASCGISKGILYHYFGNKKNFYLFLLAHCLEVFGRLSRLESAGQDDFYGILYASLDQKMSMYQTHPLEIAFLNMAARESCREVQEEKNQLLRASMGQAMQAYALTLRQAVSRLDLKEGQDADLVLKGLSLYIDAIRNGYLEKYKENPNGFFENREQVKQEMKCYLDLFLHGAVKEA